MSSKLRVELAYYQSLDGVFTPFWDALVRVCVACVCQNTNALPVTPSKPIPFKRCYQSCVTGICAAGLLALRACSLAS